MTGTQISRHEFDRTNVHGITNTATLLSAGDARIDRAIAQTGVLAPMAPLWSASTITPTASTAYFARFVPSKDMTVAKIAFVTTAAANNDDACDVGIYSSDLATKIASAGATTGKMNATAGVQTINLACSLTGGTVYYAAFSYGTIGGTAATLWSAGPSGANNGSLIFGPSVPNMVQGKANTSHPLPSSLTSAGNVSQVPILAIRES